MKGDDDHADVVSVLERAYAGAGGGVRNEISGFVFDRPGDGCPFVDSGNLQYGEVTFEGMRKVYKYLNLRPGDTFYDLGSGVGKLPLYVFLRTAAENLSQCSSFGLEVGERRHDLACMARERLRKMLSTFNPSSAASGTTSSSPAWMESCSSLLDKCPDLTSERVKSGCKFYLQDISTQRYDDANVVVLSNLLMDGGIQKKTLEQLLRCRSFRRLLTVRVVHHPRLKLKTCVHVECTWAKICSWHVYDVLPPSGISFALPSSLPAALLKHSRAGSGSNAMLGAGTSGASKINAVVVEDVAENGNADAPLELLLSETSGAAAGGVTAVPLVFPTVLAGRTTGSFRSRSKPELPSRQTVSTRLAAVAKTLPQTLQHKAAATASKPAARAFAALRAASLLASSAQPVDPDAPPRYMRARTGASRTERPCDVRLVTK
ncbi:unnamed protein product [Amoebophrya sp. A120]|nr:unnamed protein product [Amoebophrya sp. A120]|eukprot:GSA120T00002429001.1